VDLESEVRQLRLTKEETEQKLRYERLLSRGEISLSGGGVSEV